MWWNSDAIADTIKVSIKGGAAEGTDETAPAQVLERDVDYSILYDRDASFLTHIIIHGFGRSQNQISRLIRNGKFGILAEHP